MAATLILNEPRRVQASSTSRPYYAHIAVPNGLLDDARFRVGSLLRHAQSGRPQLYPAYDERMDETSLSLLNRLRRSPESETWNRLVELYEPLIRAWLRKYDVQDSDADDLVQEVLLAVSKDLGQFDHGGQPGAFRGWLKAILVNRLRKFWRARDRRPQARGDSDIHARLAQLDDPATEMSQIWNRQHDQYVLRQLLALAEPHFAPNTWKAFCRVVLDGARPDILCRRRMYENPRHAG